MNTIQSSKPQDTVRTSIFYINDLHGQFPKIPMLKSEADTFELSTKKREDVDPLFLAGGDLFIGYTAPKNKVVSSFINSSGLEYSALGNHDVDSLDILKSNIGNTDVKFVTSNLKRKGATPFDKDINNSKLTNSFIVQKNGHTYGIIGASPEVLSTKRHQAKMNKANLAVENYAETKKSIEEEVEKLQSQNIDKIIMVSHLGHAVDKQLASQVSGIDVIIGGHSHDLVEGKKIIQAPDGNPVIITQAGQNGEYFGQLDLTFDKQGHIIEATNNVQTTDNSPKSAVSMFFQDRILGKAIPLGTITRVDKMQGNSKVVENPYANFFADAMRTELDADIAMLNSANIRGTLKKGTLNSLDLDNLTPFSNPLVKAKLSEKEIVDVIKQGAKSINDRMLKPGIMQVSGLKYKIDEKGEVSTIKMLQKDGNFKELNLKNPSEEKQYTAVFDDFFLKSKEYSVLNPATIIQRYDFGKDKVAQDYIKKLDTKNIQITLDGRIENHYNK